MLVDDKEGKPVAIHQFIGRRPIACFGNSDGDKAMLEYTTINNPRRSFGLIVHHTDALSKTARFRIEKNGLLHLMDAAGKDLLRFSRMLD